MPSKEENPCKQEVKIAKIAEKPLEKAALAEVQLQENVLNSTQHELDLLGVSGTGIVCVNLLGSSRLIEGNKSVKKVIASRIIISTSSEIGEVIL